MKLTHLLATLGICSLLAVPASAESMEILFNDKVVEVDAEIVNDRTMVTPDSLEALGLSVYAEGGFWDIKKGDVSFYYDDIYKTVSGTAGEVQADVMPIITQDRQAFPLRAVAEYLGIAVGWDSYENMVVLIDLDAYFEEIKESSPELYELLALEMKQPANGKGNSDITIDLEVPDYYGDKTIFKLKLIETDAVSGNVSESNIKLEELLVSSSEFNYALSDVTIDGLFDLGTMTIYLKTNAVEKIYATLPQEYKEQAAGIAELFSGEAWYRLSMEDYISFLYETMGVYADDTYSQQITEMLDDMYKGIRLGDVFGMAAVNDYSINDVYAFEYVEEMFDAFKMVAEAGWISVETTDEANKKLKIDVTVDSIVEYSAKVSAQQGYTPTEEEIAEAKAELTGMFGDSVIAGEVNLIDGVPVKASLKLDIQADGGMFKMDVNSEFDTSADVGEIKIPVETVDLMLLIETLMQYSQAV